MIGKYLDKNNLHHAYLLEGIAEELLAEVSEFAKSLPNAEIIEIRTDTFKIEDSRNLKSLGAERSYAIGPSADEAGKKIFVISANSILREAQNAMLKLFEEPIAGTHFFLIVPDTNSLLKTLVSRFYVISARQDLAEGKQEAEKFIALPLKQRIEFIKELIAEPEEDEDILVLDSIRAKSLQFLNSLEFILHKRTMSKTVFDTRLFEHFFKVREILRMPGSSVKNLMESVALAVPVIQ